MMLWIKKLTAFAANHFQYWSNRMGANWNRFRKSQHQLTSTTAFDRYPELFREVAANIPATGAIRILSFGCSTGEECLTLKDYFPNAKILGVDISASNLRKANERIAGPNIRFLRSTPETISANGQYDVIFCLSVLCRWEDTKDLENCEKIYPFRKFEETVTMLSNNLKPRGLLVIYNSNFRFEETGASGEFVMLETPGIKDSGFVHKFDRNNNRIHDLHTGCIYRKL